MAAARYHLAGTLREVGDLAGAEAELREALRHSPNIGPAHNFLGILLFKRGDLAGAAAELRVSAQLQPKDATVHFNLAQVLENADPNAALDEYRMAATLAPDNVAFKARFEKFERTPHSAVATEATGTTIKVEVRQVLVPVVVTDQQGHHVTGLTQADFHVFEDGVEQKISGFSVENIGAGSLPPLPAAGSLTSSAAVLRTYLICIDTLHSEFGNLVRVRTALSKLFSSEHAGDAQYVVLAVGTSTQVVQGLTTDPATVLKAIESKDFQPLVLGSRKDAISQDMQDFRRDLEEARKACDARQPECRLMVRSLPFGASQIASTERAFTVAFLEQLRDLVKELAKETGRRTMVLFSDGFQLDPGKQAFELLDAYFPGLRDSLAPDRITDLDDVLRLAANRNVPIYTIDSRGLYTLGDFSVPNPRIARAVTVSQQGIAWETGGTLEDIASATGGTAFRNNNDIFAGLERAFADGRQYYVLAYVPSNADSDGNFRAISVRVRDGKLSVNAKRGYWAVGNLDGR